MDLEKGEVSGYIGGVGLRDIHSFGDTPGLLLLIDQLLDQIGKPQATRRSRSFRENSGTTAGGFCLNPPDITHLKKSGTPTMGGLIILLGIVIASLFYVRRYPMIIPVLFVTLGFGFIGFIDDYIKVVMKRNLGLRAWQKMFGRS